MGSLVSDGEAVDVEEGERGVTVLVGGGGANGNGADRSWSK